MSFQLFNDSGLIYTEIENKMPIVRAFYPKYDEKILKLIAIRSMPYNMDTIEQINEMFSVFQINEDLIAISFFKYFSTAKTLYGSSQTGLTLVTKKMINPYKIKPFLESTLTRMLKIKTDNKLLKQILDSFESDGSINLEKKFSFGSFRINSKILKDEDIPSLFIDLDYKNF